MMQTANRVEKRFASAKLVQRILSVRQDAFSLVLLECENLFWAKANRKHRPTHYRRDDSFEAAAVQRQLCFQNGAFMIQARAAPCSNGVERARGLARWHFAHCHKCFTYPLGPENGIGVQQEVFGTRIGEVGQYEIAQFTL